MSDRYTVTQVFKSDRGTQVPGWGVKLPVRSCILDVAITVAKTCREAGIPVVVRSER